MWFIQYVFRNSILSEYCCSSVMLSLLRGSRSGQPFYLFIYFFTILGMSTKLHTSHFLQYILSLHTLIDNMRGFQECMRLDSAHLFAYLYLTIHQHVRKKLL